MLHGGRARFSSGLKSVKGMFQRRVFLGDCSRKTYGGSVNILHSKGFAIRAAMREQGCLRREVMPPALCYPGRLLPGSEGDGRSYQYDLISSPSCAASK